MSEPMRLALRRGTDDIVQRIALCLQNLPAGGAAFHIVLPARGAFDPARAELPAGIDPLAALFLL